MEFEFFTWEAMGTLSGAMFAVAIITQIIKNLPGVSRIPTQLVSYVLALVVLIAAHAFTDGLTASVAALAAVNAAVVSLAANGGYAALKRLQNGSADSEGE